MGSWEEFFALLLHEFSTLAEPLTLPAGSWLPSCSYTYIIPYCMLLFSYTRTIRRLQSTTVWACENFCAQCWTSTGFLFALRISGWWPVNCTNLFGQWWIKKVYLLLQRLSQDLWSDMLFLSSLQVPVIAILGSGGGFRAMVGFAGVMKALYESGILDCATYIAGLSGSTW